jgi:hypothetical protein
MGSFSLYVDFIICEMGMAEFSSPEPCLALLATVKANI